MMRRIAILSVLLVLLAAGSSFSAESTAASPPEAPALNAAPGGTNQEDNGYQDDTDQTGEEQPVTIADPLEPFNRAMYVFNDKVYFWVLKPAAQGYSKVAPEPVRIGVKNFFSNLRFPVRFVNLLLQAQFRGAATELGRFGINTTVGVAGFMDPASSRFHLRERDTDLGLTLASYGIGHGFFIEWPLLGPSSPRDTAGMAGDYFLDPVSYVSPWYASAGIRTYKEVNATSLSIGDYESLKQAAIDPYLAIRDAYVQYRLKKNKGEEPEHQQPVKPLE